MTDEKRIIFTLPTDLLDKLDAYAEKEYRGNRNMAIYQIIKTFLDFEKHNKGEK